MGEGWERGGEREGALARRGEGAGEDLPAAGAPPASPVAREEREGRSTASVGIGPAPALESAKCAYPEDSR